MSQHRNIFIDELKGLAIVAVVMFHLGLFKWGYLGVDVFFAIAGYLTAKSVVRRMDDGSFRYWGFLGSRILRLWPLVLLSGGVALAVGCVLMMPDDLDHLARSVAASNCFLNNILCYHSNSDYWATKNEYAPMLHLWYLGVLMQLYVVYPVVERIGRRLNMTKVLIAVLGVASLVGWCLTPVPLHFYNMPFRFFEFGIGVLAFHLRLRIPDWSLRIPGLSALGSASLSIYVWHYIILAFVRYSIAPSMTVGFVVAYVAALAVASWLSYRFVEPLKMPKWLLGGCFLVLNGAAAFLYFRAGVIRDIPELDVYAKDVKPGMHLAYCDRIYNCDRDFPDNSKVNVLVMGNSWARDWANVLWESSVSNRINLSYSFSQEKTGRDNLLRRIRAADVVFVRGPFTPPEVANKKVYHIGYKYFGPSNGFAYSRRFFSDYYNLSIDLPQDVIETNESDKKECGDSLIDLIGALQNEDGRIPVFSDEKKMISHDCYHLTQGGAKYIARRMQKRIEEIIPLEKESKK